MASERDEEETERSSREPSTERYFSVRWMLESERATEGSDDCSSAFAIIPVVGVCMLMLYVICLDQASQGFAVWLAGGSPLSKFLPFKFLLSQGFVGDWDVSEGIQESPVPGAYA